MENNLLFRNNCDTTNSKCNTELGLTCKSKDNSIMGKCLYVDNYILPKECIDNENNNKKSKYCCASGKSDKVDGILQCVPRKPEDEEKKDNENDENNNNENNDNTGFTSKINNKFIKLNH